MHPESGFRIAPIYLYVGKWQRPHNFPTLRHHQISWRFFVSLVKFSYWSKLHANTITVSGVMTIYFYKGLTRNPENENTPAWVLPKISRLGWFSDTKFGRIPGLQLLPFLSYQDKTNRRESKIARHTQFRVNTF